MLRRSLRPSTEVVKLGALLAILAMYTGCSASSAPLDTEPKEDAMAGPLVNKQGWQVSSTLSLYNRTTVPSLQADFKVAGAYTVQFDTGALFGRTEADIVWSVEGATVRRTVSVAKGVEISGVGQGVKVTLRDVTVFTVAVPETAYAVSAQVAPGTRANTRIPPLLWPVGVSLTGLPMSVTVPKDCGVIGYRLYGATGVAGVITPLRVIVDPQGNGFSYGAYLWDDIQDYIPLPPGVDTIAFNESVAGNVSSAQISFVIDG
jgi:hypothetical protein